MTPSPTDPAPATDPVALLTRDLRVRAYDARTPFPHLAAVCAARELLIARAEGWAVAGDCGCPLLRLDLTTTRRALEDVGVLIYRLGTETLAAAAIPHPDYPAACLRWTETACLGAGLTPVDPATPVDPSHEHGPDMHPPRGRIGWLRTSHAAWAYLPQPLRLVDQMSGESWPVDDAADLAPLFDDDHAHPVVTPLPAQAEVLRLLSRDELLPQGLPRSVQTALLRDRDRGRVTQRRPLIRLLRSLHGPPPLRDWTREERALIRGYRREAQGYPPLAVQSLCQTDFERGPSGDILIDGMAWAAWVAVQRATWVRAE